MTAYFSPDTHFIAVDFPPIWDRFLEFLSLESSSSSKSTPILSLFHLDGDISLEPVLSFPVTVQFCRNPWRSFGNCEALLQHSISRRNIAARLGMYLTCVLYLGFINILLTELGEMTLKRVGKHNPLPLCSQWEILEWNSAFVPPRILFCPLKNLSDKRAHQSLPFLLKTLKSNALSKSAFAKWISFICRFSASKICTRLKFQSSSHSNISINRSRRKNIQWNPEKCFLKTESSFGN